MIFDGQFDDQIFGEYRHWYHYIADIYLPLADSESGDFRHFPGGDVLMREPWIDMQILYHVQASYRAYVSKRMRRN